MSRPNNTADYFRFAVIFFAVLVALRFLWMTRNVVLIAALAILLGVTLSRGVDYLERLHIKRPLGTLILIVLGLGSIVGIAFAIAPTLTSQMDELKQKMPGAIQQFEQKLRRTPIANAALQVATQQPGTLTGKSGSQTTGQPSDQATGHQGDQTTSQQPSNQQPSPQQPQQQPHRQQSTEATRQPGNQATTQQPSNQATQQPGHPASALSGHLQTFIRMLFPFVTNSVAAIAGLVVILFLAAYFAVDPQLYRRGMVALVPPKRRKRAEELFDELADLLRQWFLARVMAMIAVGVITGVALAFLKIPAAAALGLIAGLLEFVPFVGPIASAIPAIAMALIVSPTKAIYVIILFVILQQLEGNLITPLLMKKRLDVPPVVTILAVAALGVVFGIPGMLIAEPLSAVVILAVRELYVDRMEETAA